jgi:hypothetical protein
VEADADAVRVVLHQQGQVMLRFEWDGVELQQTRAPQLPSNLSAQRVLDDLQLVYWPAGAIAIALPEGWALHDAPGRRALLEHDETVATVSWTNAQQVRLENRREGYRLDITSVPAEP